MAITTGTVLSHSKFTTEARAPAQMLGGMLLADGKGCSLWHDVVLPAFLPKGALSPAVFTLIITTQKKLQSNLYLPANTNVKMYLYTQKAPLIISASMET